MARTKDAPNLRNRSNRSKLAKRKEPYWMPMEKGRTLGYYKGENGGNWIAKFCDPTAKPARQTKALGAADDFSEPDGKMVLSFGQAQEAAREWFKEAFHQATGERVQTGDYTVRDACLDYLADREWAGAKTAKRMKWDFEARILPALGDIPAAKLTRRRIELWMEELADSAARYRGKEAPKASDVDSLRARKSTANRLWTMLRAALNLAHRDRKVPSNAGWRDVLPFKGTRSARVRFLSVQDQQRLVNAAESPDFRRLLQAGLFTGAREGELARLRKADFDPENRNLFIELSKTGKKRYITLTAEGVAFFSEITAGLAHDDLILPRTTYLRRDGVPSGIWTRAELCRRMAETCKAAKLEPMVFHELRHTYASGLVNAGLPLIFIAAQLGHRDTRMVEEHYGHLCQTAKTLAIQSLAPVLGIHQPNGVEALKIKES